MRRQSASSKEARALMKAIEGAGGSVTLTKRGHLRVIGPGGMAILGSAPSKRSRNQENAISLLKRCAGIDLAAN